eukprot:COSAG01_NODE_469_length_16584_cov_10.725265_8_plen_91_part_00
MQARDALCAGDTDFVFTTDGLGVLAWAYPAGTDTQSFSSQGEQMEQQVQRDFPSGGDPARRDGKSPAKNAATGLYEMVGRTKIPSTVSPW